MQEYIGIEVPCITTNKVCHGTLRGKGWVKFDTAIDWANFFFNQRDHFVELKHTETIWWANHSAKEVRVWPTQLKRGKKQTLTLTLKDTVGLYFISDWLRQNVIQYLDHSPKNWF